MGLEQKTRCALGSADRLGLDSAGSNQKIVNLLLLLMLIANKKAALKNGPLVMPMWSAYQSLQHSFVQFIYLTYGCDRMTLEDYPWCVLC